MKWEWEARENHMQASPKCLLSRLEKCSLFLTFPPLAGTGHPMHRSLSDDRAMLA